MSELVKLFLFECIDLFIVNEMEVVVFIEKDLFDDIVVVFKEQWLECEVIIILGKVGVMMLKNNDCIKVDVFLVDVVDIMVVGDIFIGYFLLVYSNYIDVKCVFICGCVVLVIVVMREGVV